MIIIMEMTEDGAGQDLLTERTSDETMWSEWEAPWVASVDPASLHPGVVYDLVYVGVSAPICSLHAILPPFRSLCQPSSPLHLLAPPC